MARSATYVFLLTLAALASVTVGFVADVEVPSFMEYVLTLLVGASAGIAHPGKVNNGS